MLYRLLFSAAVVAGVYWLVDRQTDRDVVAAAHRVGDDEAGFDLIGQVLEEEHLRHGAPATCTVTRGLAMVLASRRAQARIAAGLRQARLSRPAPALV